MDEFAEARPLRALAVASLSLGLLSLLLFWWFPFGLILSAAGLVLGLFCWAVGVHGGALGERFGLGGVILCAASVAIGLALGWGTYVRLWGL
jgi:hypothetical protein